MGKAMVFPVRFVAEGQTVQTTSRDLDDESVFVRCVEPPGVGDRVALRLYLPGLDAPGSFEGEVVESGGEGFRARFTQLVQEQRTLLSEALRADGAAAPAQLEPMPVPAAENRRLLPRYLGRFRVTLGSGSERANQQALNLSATGLFIATDTPPQVDDIVQVVLELPDGEPPAELQAVVLHRVLDRQDGTSGAGVQFIGADDAFRQRLDRCLAQLRASGSRPSR